MLNMDELGGLSDALLDAREKLRGVVVGSAMSDDLYCAVMNVLDAAAECGLVTNADVADWLTRAEVEIDG